MCVINYDKDHVEFAFQASCIKDKNTYETVSLL